MKNEKPISREKIAAEKQTNLTQGEQQLRKHVKFLQGWHQQWMSLANWYFSSSKVIHGVFEMPVGQRTLLRDHFSSTLLDPKHDAADVG